MSTERDIMDRLTDENTTRLEREAAAVIYRLRQELEDVATGKLLRLNAEDGRIDVTLRDGYGMKCLAASFGDYFRSVGATNFLTVDVLDQVTKPDDPLPMTVTIQRKGCKSPSEAIAEKDAEITRLRTELEAERVRANVMEQEVRRLCVIETAAFDYISNEGVDGSKALEAKQRMRNIFDINADPLAAAHIAAAKKPETAPLECVTCGAASEKQHPVDADHAGWLCPTCYAAAKKGDER